MPSPSLPKRELPRWIQEHLERERGVAEGDESLRAVAAESKIEDEVQRGWKPGHWKRQLNLNLLKICALFFLLPGLGGLVFSAMVSTDYQENLPRVPSPDEERVTPRNVHGVVIYQTVEEDKRLSAMEYASVSVFLIGLLLGIWYLEKWSAARQQELETELLEEFEV